MEGISDRIFFESLFDYYGRSNSRIIEIINVDGKKLFNTYKRLLEACNITFSIIADLDYAEDIGPKEVKVLFQSNPSKIKNNLTQNNNSKDAEAFIQIIDKAINTADMQSLREIWDYIKDRHKKLKNNLSVDEVQTLKDFILKKQAENCYILQKGALEAYLPTGYQSKDIEKLVAFLDQENFIDQIDKSKLIELETIIKSIINLPISKKQQN